ncbi:hypothetical protein IAR55_000224 [Kwoniella newhampshirensis]|uniref:LIM zinc-binding domain-containing protein n=1 Tax=Kwoniella newhampshirensis TaxID=1651941 RepID=A0AAW0Z6H3_9TREE
MSLLAPRLQEPERASVILPTVTCSSCAAPIPLSSLGEHVCRPPSRGMSNRTAPRPSQITIPQARPTVSRQGSSQGPSPVAVRPPFAGPSSAHPSPTEFVIPRRPSPNNLSPHDPSGNGFCGYTPNARTPSPTNPFFPHPDGLPAAGLGLGVSVSSSTGAQDSAMMIDTTSGGESGMAGVGRRAFAAAAWGVRAGVALANHARSPTEPSGQQVIPAWQQTPRSDPTPREAPILPKVPLSGRQRSNPGPPPRPTIAHSHTAPPMQHAPLPSRTPSSPPQRSASAMSQRAAQPVSPPRRKESISSDTSSRASKTQESISQLLKGRSAVPGIPAKPGFFDKVKELNSRCNTSAPVLGIGMARGASGGSSNDQFVSSPAGTTFELEDDYDDLNRGSALPWATPQLADSPVINQGQPTLGGDDPAKSHHRYPTAGSEASSSSSMSSTRSGRWGATSGPENEEVVTPSQSWEGLADRASVGSGRNDEGFGRVEGRDILQQIGEEDEDDEGERVVFGTPSAQTVKGGDNIHMPNSHSASTITSAPAYHPTGPHPSPSRSRTMPIPPTNRSPSKSSTSGSSSSDRRRKTCQKCGDSVGGSKRFVERDGVVLCEKDWKKLYLPSCRRCNLPIEKSAVSSSDGQLKGKWHRACFTCTRCDNPFEGDSFYVHAGKPWCQHHYHEENGTLCASSSCRQPIEGPCILTPGPNPQRFHPNHLRCDHRGGVSGAQTCRESMEEYYDVGGERFCERHVGDALRKIDGDGRVSGGLGQGMLRAEKRRTRLVELPVGGF